MLDYGTIGEIFIGGGLNLKNVVEERIHEENLEKAEEGISKELLMIKGYVLMGIGEILERIRYRQSQGAKTLNILGGEPAVSIHGILELLAEVDPDTTVVFNSNMYYGPLVGELLYGLVDIYLADLKCSGKCSKDLLGDIE